MMQQPGFGIVGLRGYGTVEDDEVIRRQEDKLAHHHLAFVGVVHRCSITGNVAVVRSGLERDDLRADQLILSAGLQMYLAVPVRAGLFVRHLDEDTVMGDGLGVVVLQAITVALPRPAIQRQEALLVDGEVRGIIVMVAGCQSACGKQYVGVLQAGT